MAQFLQMDPVAKDYVFENGSPVETDDIAQRVYMDVSIPKNAWLYGQTDQGSLLYTLENTKRTALIEQQFASYVEDAVNQQSIANGYATKVGVDNIATSRTGTSNRVQVVPTTVPVSSTLNFVSV